MMGMECKTIAGLFAVGLAVVSPLPAVAQAAPDEVTGLRKQVEDLRASEAAALRRVDELESRLNRLEAIAGEIQGLEPIGAAEESRLRGRYLAPQPRAIASDRSLAYFQRNDQEQAPGTGALSSGSSAVGADEPDRKSPAPTIAVEDVTEQQQGHFGRRIGFDLGVGYSHFSNARINLDGFLALDTIFLGTISIDKATSDIFTLDPTVSVGLSDNFIIDANVPYLFRASNFQSGGAGGAASGLVEETVHGNGLGDISVGASYRLMKETAGRPDLVVNARVKFPTGRDPYGIEFVDVSNSQGNLQVPRQLSTGTGVYSASIGLSALKTLDPMIVFGSMNYYHNFQRSFGDVDEAPGDQPGNVNVGNAIQFGAGMAYALNDKSSISMSYSQRIVQHSRIRRSGEAWQRIVGSQGNVALVNLGGTFSLADNLSLVTAVGIGLTDDSPDMLVSVRIPYRF